MAPPIECPIPRTHRRLGDVYAIWHEALGAYPDPEEFRLKLNNLLQETRNVTWVLQAEKHAIADFDSWYPEWRARMASVSVMRWALEMRNHVVKKGDLAARSIARVSMLAAWDNPPAAEIAVPPMVGPDSIASRLRAAGIPPEFARDAVAVVERRWVVDSLPEREVLDALAECYVMLYQLVLEAHDRLGVVMTTDSIEAKRRTWSEDALLKDRPAGMVMSQEVRTARLKLATREWLRLEHEDRVVTKEDFEKVRDRYGELPQARAIPATALDLFEHAAMIFEVAQRMLIRDLTHGSFAWLFGPEGIEHHVLRPDDRADKYVIWNKVADDVERRKDWGLITVGEVWSFHGDLRGLNVDPASIRGVEDIPGHGEGLQVAAAFRDGQTRMYGVDFTHDESGNIIFGKTEGVGYSPESLPQFLIPVLKVWQAWRKRESGNDDEPLTISSRPGVIPTP